MPKGGSKAASKKATGAAAMSKDTCPHCSKSVEEDDFALACEVCDNWFHISCEEVSEDEYSFLKDHKSIVHWYCKSCNKSVVNTIKLFSGLKLKVEGLEENVSLLTKKLECFTEGKLPENLSKAIDTKATETLTKFDSLKDSLQTEILSLKDQVSKTETKLETAIEAKLVESVSRLQKDLEPTWATIASKEVNAKFESVTRDVTQVQSVLEETRMKANEERERESRSNNVIIYRFPEIDNKDERVKADKAFCLELFNSVLEVEVGESDFKCFRIGKRDSNNRPLMVQCREKTLKNKIMESLHKLRNAESKFKNISVTHDLTLAERTECKKLVEDAKKKQNEETGNTCGG